MNKKFKIKTGDSVIIIAGKDKGKTGNVSSVLKANDRVIVEGVNIVKRHRKATQESPGKLKKRSINSYLKWLMLTPKVEKLQELNMKLKTVLKEGYQLYLAHC